MNFEKGKKVEGREAPSADRSQFLKGLQSNLVHSKEKALENYNKIITVKSDEK